MKITTTRVPTAELRPLVIRIAAELDRVEQDLATKLIILSADDRKTVPRTRAGFAAVARTFADLIATRKDIAAVADFNAEEVREDLDNVALIDPLLPRLKNLVRRLEDSRLKWLAEAQEPTLAAYAIAKARAERDGTLAAVIEPLKKVLANGPMPNADRDDKDQDATEGEGEENSASNQS